MLARLEMGVGKTKEDLLQLGLGEEVGQEFHRVGAEAGEVLVCVCGGVLGAEGFDFLLHEFRDGAADFETQDLSAGEVGGEREEEASEPAAYVCDGDFLVWGGGGVVRGPVHGGGGWWAGEGDVSVGLMNMLMR